MLNVLQSSRCYGWDLGAIQPTGDRITVVFNQISFLGEPNG